MFAELNLLKLQDYIKLQTLFFMHQFNTGKLAKIFDSFFVKTSCKHNVKVINSQSLSSFKKKTEDYIIE